MDRKSPSPLTPDALQSLKYLRLLETIATVEALRSCTGLAVVDVEPMVGFTGQPEEAGVVIILATEAERRPEWERRSVIADQVHRLLAEEGYPAEAAPEVFVRLASEELIRAFGGRDSYLR
jgi:hypothetical protein